ncbi:MAG: universal stress protein [Bacteroidales bacterium]|nr:universal stress protein [Bacteroidales bacterium]MBN2821384.1 universal stress protein [Bacteroidales bacterium]
MDERNVILVTWDFTEKSEFAYENAVLAASNLRSDIIFLHIAKKESEVKSLEERLNGVIAEKYADRTPKPKAFVKVGSIFTAIGETAEELNARMVFMGTHGIKGSQKFFGSWALKVIAHTKVPFIVVQDAPKQNQFKDIVFPINYRKENKESINWIGFFSKYFNSNIHLFKAKHTDSNFVKGVDSNMLFLTRNFKNKGIDHIVVEAPGQTDFVKETVDYAQKINAGSLLVMTTKDIGITDYMLGAQEQYIIANSFNIPVICINPRPAKIGGSFSTSGS